MAIEGKNPKVKVAPIEKPKPSKNQQIVDFWISKKYWDSGCIDEAIDWNNHPNEFTVDQMIEFHEWLTQVEALKRQVVKLVPDYDKIVDLLKLL